MSTPRVTVATLFREAKRNGWPDPGEPGDAMPQNAAPRFRITAPGAWSPDAGRRQIWRGRLSEGDLGAVIAPPYAGKSLLAPFIAWRITQGANAFGRPTVATPSAWFAVEDSHGAADRVEALRRTWGEAKGFRLVTAGESGFSLLRDADVDALAETVARERFGVLVLDTLSAAAPGHRENDVEHVSLTIARLRRITRSGCAVFVVHHVAKAGDTESPTARGSGDLQAAFDVVMALTKNREGHEVLTRIVKNRNGPPEAFGFRLGVVDLGARDRWGEPIRAPVLAEELSAEAARGTKPITGASAAILRTLDSLGGTAPMTSLADAACVIGVVSGSDKKDSRQAAFRRGVEKLQALGVVEVMPSGIVRRGGAPVEKWPEGEE